jgi:hypothetical protein
VALGVKDLPQSASKPQALAKILRADQARVGETYHLCQEMLTEARFILASLDEPFLVRLVDVTGLRLDTYFRKELHFSPSQ